MLQSTAFKKLKDTLLSVFINQQKYYFKRDTESLNYSYTILPSIKTKSMT